MFSLVNILKNDGRLTVRNRSSRVFWAMVVAVVLLAGCYIWLQVLPLLATRGTGVPGLASHQNDYKHLYLGSRLLARGVSPYDSQTMLEEAGHHATTEDARFNTILPYVYLPFTGWVLRPLTGLPFAWSAAAFQIVNHLLVLGGLLLAVRLALARSWVLAAAITLLLTAFNHPLIRQNNAGQLNALLLAGLALLYTGERRGWPAPAVGGVTAFLMLFKLSPGIFLIWFLLRREWAKAAWTAGIAAGLTLGMVFLYGVRTHLDFVPVLQDMGYGKSTWAEYGHTFWRDRTNVSPNATFHRFFVEKEGTGITPWVHLGHGVANAMTWGVSLLVIAVFAIGTATTRARRRLDAPFALAICTSLLLPSILWDHYLVQLLLPIVLLSACALQRANPAPALTIIAIAAVIVFMPLPIDMEPLLAGPGLLVQSLKLVPVLICFGLAAWFALSDENNATPQMTAQPQST